MAVGRAIEQATGIGLFHNHMTIEPVLKFFDFGTPAFGRLVGNFRQALIAEVAASESPGLCFTFVWNLDDESDRHFLEAACRPFRAAGATIAFIELKADLAVRLQRNRSLQRLAEKPSKRDLATSEANLLKLDHLRLNSAGSIGFADPHLVIDNTHLRPEQVADTVIEALAIPRC